VRLREKLKVYFPIGERTMKNAKWFATPLTLAGALLFASTCFGQITPQIVAVGSSGAFGTAAVAAVVADPITGSAAPCGTNFWTGNTNVASGLDDREAGIPAEPGKIWIAWNGNGTTTTTIICAYLTVDSVVGQRLFFSQHQSPITGGQVNGVLQLSSSAVGAAGAGLVSYVTDNATLTSFVQESVNGQQFNVAFTDIRPEDAQYFNVRAQCSPADAEAQCLGYGPFPVGTAVQSAYSINTGTGLQNSAQVIQYNINGDDPISEYPIPAFTTYPIGAQAVVHFYNATDTSAGGFGTLLPTNVNSHVLAVTYAGFLGLTTDISGTQGVTGKPLHVILREPTSGTMNTVEWQIFRAKGVDLSQEWNVRYGTNANCTTFTASPNPATYATPVTSGPCTNPLYLPGPSGSFRARAVGSGEEVSATNSANNPNSIGYAFWSFANYGGKTNLRYLKLDDVDPLSVATFTGVFPTCTGTANGSPSLTCEAVPLTNIQQGGYRNWNILRATVYNSYTAPATGPSITSFIESAQDSAEKTVFDLVPVVYCANAGCSSKVNNLPVFKSHYVLPSQGISAADGTHGEAEGGGDVLGAIFTVQADIDYFNATGTEFTEYLQ
jgi:ABC-type phosphate transport system substrate-binding protein